MFYAIGALVAFIKAWEWGVYKIENVSLNTSMLTVLFLKKEQIMK